MTTENKYIHNALKQTHLQTKRFNLSGFSISGLASYHLLPELNFAVDMGECPLTAIPIDHVFLTHAHGDHSRCLMRHHSLRKMMGLQKDAAYYLSEKIYEKACQWIRAEAAFEGVPEYRIQIPNLIPIKTDEKIILQYRKDLALEAFEVSHSIHTLGCTLFQYKKKLLEKYLKCTTQEIIELRQNNVEITQEIYEPLVTFMGDCKSESLLDKSSIWKSPILVTECTFIDDNEIEMAQKKGHSHLNKIIAILEEKKNEIECEKIILNHFSMKYSEKHILEALESKLPEFIKDKITVML